MPTGVYIAKKKDNTEYYRVSFTFKNKHISLGSFDDIKKAEKVYKNAVAIINNSSEYMVNPELHTTTYNASLAIPFDKFIRIIKTDNLWQKHPKCNLAAQLNK